MHRARILPVCGFVFCLLTSSVALAASPTGADRLKMLISADPSDTAVVSSAEPSRTLGAALGKPVQALASNNLTDAMRATRTHENQLIIGPAHVAASAMSHAYRLVATNGKPRTFVLVAQKSIAQPAQLKGKRLYLPQQDSLRSYVARGMLEQASLSLKDFGKVEFRNTSGAGLIALGLGTTDATVAEAAEAEAWIKANPGKGRILLTSREVPGGLTALVHKDVPPDQGVRIVKWLTAAEPAIGGLAAFVPPPQGLETQFQYVASLGILTPESLAGATRLNADEVAKMLDGTVKPVVADVRSSKEFEAATVPGAVSAPYGEKSLKERDYDAKLDDFSAIAKLDKSKPTVFFCNGPECWKSYKASREAIKLGFAKVYWFRGGMPEWQKRAKN